MSWVSVQLHGLARAFTIPKSERDYIKKNPLSAIEKEGLSLASNLALNSLVAGISDPQKQSAARALLEDGIQSTGLLK